MEINSSLFRGDIQHRRVTALNIIAWLYSIPFIPKAIRIIGIYSFSGLRTRAFVASEYASTSQLTILQTIVQPIFTVTILCTILAIALRKKRIKPLVLMSLIDLALDIVLFADRTLILQVVFFSYFSIYIIARGKIVSIIKLFMKQYKKLVWILLVAIVTVLMVTIFRSGSGVKHFCEQLYYYYCGSFTFFGVLLKEGRWKGNQTFGRVIFGFVFGLFAVAKKYLMGGDYLGGEYYVTQITSVYRYIGSDVPYNALGTMMFPFVVDFGLCGVILGSIFCGFMMGTVEKKVYNTFSLGWLATYVYIIMYIFSSVQNYYFMSPAVGFTFIFIVLCTSTKISFGKRV